MMPSSPDTIVMIEDSPTEARLNLSYLHGEKYRIVHGATGRAGLRLLEREQPDAVLLDLGLPDIGGLEILQWIGDRGLETSVIVVTAEAGIDTVVSAMRLGAFDYLVKPFGADRLRITLRNALEHRHMNKLVDSYRASFEDGFLGLIGTSAPIQAVYRTIEAAASSMATVFITGESGTGKELCAEAVHRASPRCQAPFVPINCAAIPKEIMESEIFGHVKGAFTGAASDRKGAAEVAHGGTLFLDEVCEMDLGLQAKMLRFVHSRRFQRVGESRERQADIRFVCATNKDPAAMVAQGRFREDLYYRLHVIPIHMPRLADRGDDALKIARHILGLTADQEGKRFCAFSADAEALIADQPWPGNVRQLQNVLRKAVVLHDGELLSAQMITIDPQATSPIPIQAAPLPRAPGARHPAARDIRPLSEVEQAAIEDAIAACAGNVTAAARLLDINPSTVYRKRQGWARDAAPQPNPPLVEKNP